MIKLLITKPLYYILCITQFLMDFVLNLDTENGRIFILVKKKIIINRKKIIREIYDPEHAGFKATEIVQNSYNVDISSILVYNALVYVLMEFRGHT